VNYLLFVKRQETNFRDTAILAAFLVLYLSVLDQNFLLNYVEHTC